jgi:hypothetical protein
VQLPASAMISSWDSRDAVSASRYSRGACLIRWAWDGQVGTEPSETHAESRPFGYHGLSYAPEQS